MKIKIWVILFGFLLTTVLINSCTHGGCRETKNSSAGDRESHNAGRNCMHCHTSLGEGEGCFTAAGTIYDSLVTGIYPNATVRLYTQPNGGGNLAATLQGDAKGNFFTTNSIDFANGLYPSVTGSSGQTRYMSTGILTGACGSCHGAGTQGVIYAM